MSHEEPSYFEQSAPKKHELFLSAVEERFHVDFSFSRQISGDTIRRAHRLTEIFNTALYETYHQEYTGNFLLLTEFDHRQLALADIGEREKDLARRMFGDDKHIIISDARDSWEQEYVPGGHYLTFYMLGRFEQAIVITHFDSASNNPNAAVPLEARVIEEMLHGESSMSILTLENVLDLPEDQTLCYVGLDLDEKRGFFGGSEILRNVSQFGKCLPEGSE